MIKHTMSIAARIFSIGLLAFANSCNTPRHEYPFQDPDISVQERVDDLVNRMTLEEKVSQTLNSAPAIERLGVPEYDWWNEALHGVARAGLATVYPQAIGLAATWDEDMMFRVSTAISDEARAKHHRFASQGKRLRYQGLTIWSPNINIFRDPRWGRGQETYGEDPFLTGKLAIQFIKGLQGDDEAYFKTIATVKHFAVHSGPEPERHSFNAVTDQRDFLDFYLPQFEMGIKEGQAYSAMCAYNRYNGEACCGSDQLLNDLLRNDWGFNGFIVSDCGAIADIYQHHKIVSTPEEAAALAVKSGTDLNCGEVYKHLTAAVEKGLITEAEIDVAVKRLFTARFRLGMFDPDEKVKYARIPYDVVDSKAHQALALEAARKSITLLKNENNLLPLKKETGTVAVIGPNADQWLMLLGNYNGIPSDPVTPLRGIREKLEGKSKVIYAQGSELADGMPVYEIVPANVFSEGVQVEYYNNKDLAGEPAFTETAKNVNENWFDKAPRQGMNDDDFGVRWAGSIVPETTGMYQLGMISVCKTQLYLNDSLIAKTTYGFRDEYGDPRLNRSEAIYLEAGKPYKIKVEAGESYGDAQVQLVWAKPKSQLKEEALNAARQADAVIMCVGLTARMEGEEMRVEIDGFRGGDRTKLDLPAAQQDLIREIHRLGKPVVLVLMSGSAVALNWEDENIPAIVQAWYPGQAAGHAIADVLFGDYNPAGRLPVTFYRSVDDLPPFDQYEITTQTYRYFPHEPLYPFGFGLSYTTFRYDDLQFENENRVEDTVRIAATVTNTGNMAGDEVVQLYISQIDAPVRTPIRALKDFTRIHLQPGESATTEFMLPPDAFSIIDENNQRIVRPGKYMISVGGGQPGGRYEAETGAECLFAEIVLK